MGESCTQSKHNSKGRSFSRATFKFCCSCRIQFFNSIKALNFLFEMLLTQSFLRMSCENKMLVKLVEQNVCLVCSTHTRGLTVHGVFWIKG